MTEPTQYQSINSTLAVWLIFLYWIVYEWIFFFYPIDFGGVAFFYLTNFIKLFLPIVLIGIVGIPSLALLNRKVALGLYTFFFFALIVWSTIPTVISGSPVDVLKQIPRFIFFIAVASLFLKNPEAMSSYSKLIIGVVIFALAQYLSIYLFNATGSGFSVGGAPPLAGPFGIFGTGIGAMMFFPSFDLPVVRLMGFWNEPSNASASAFAAFFLSRYLFVIEQHRFWRYASYCCLAAGLLCISNAGYLALGVALLFGVFVIPKKFSARRFAGLIILFALTSLLIFAALFGRGYVASNYADNDLLRAIVGLREARTYVDINDQSGGRIELAEMTISTIIDNPIGIGLQSVGSEGIDSSASAPIYWLYLTGIPGLVFLLLRESVLLFCAIYLVKRLPSSIYLVQAWIVVLVQQMSYGSWMNPNYLILAAAVLSMAAGVSRTVRRPKLV